jgi:hypothetical protein
MAWEITIIIILIYIFLVFILSHFVVPHLTWWNEKVPEQIPATMTAEINRLKALAQDKQEFFELCFNYLGSKYYSDRVDTFYKYSFLFKNTEEIWGITGYVPCTQSNWVMKIFIVSSGYFKNEEVWMRHIFFNFFLHQYGEVYLDGRWVAFEVGEKQKQNISIGRHMKFFDNPIFFKKHIMEWLNKKN